MQGHQRDGSSDVTREPEELTLYGRARELFAKTREALDEHVGEYAGDGEGWKLGGGTVLAARWRHRESDDLDILYDADTETAHFESKLEPAMEEAGGKPGPWGELSRIDFGEQHIDLMKIAPTPGAGHRKATVDGHPTTVLSSVQILSGKLRNRALDPPVRDVYDVAVCGIEDPESLEKAINGLYPAKLDSIILGWKMNEAAHAADAAEQVRGEPKRLEQVRRRPAQYAIQAAENAIYRKVSIAAERGKVTVETRSATAARRQAYSSAEALEEGFESTGMNDVLRANRRNPSRIRKLAVDAMAREGRTIIVEVTPEQPPRRQERLEPVPKRARGPAPARPVVRRGRRPAMPLQHRHGYAADLHRGLPVGDIIRQGVPRVGNALLCGRDPPGSGRWFA